MKKLVLTLTLTLACVAAFAQGKVRFVNDSLHLVYFTTDTGSLLQADQALAGLSAPGPTPSGQVLVADLWGGTSAASLSKLTTTTWSATAGVFNGANITTPFAAGTAPFFQVQIYDQAMGSYAAAAASLGHYFGESAIFTTTTSGTIAYNSITSTQFSTWAVGTQDESSSAFGNGAKGAISIMVNPVPEPTSLALFGLGSAALLIFRRRK